MVHLVWDCCKQVLTLNTDIFLGIGSTAIKFGENNRLILSTFGITCITGFLASGFAAEQTLPYCIVPVYVHNEN
jgi:4-hydroxybenzoate polyprenyltransferase